MSRTKHKHKEYMRRWRAARKPCSEAIAVTTGVLGNDQVSQHSVGPIKTVTLGNAYKKPDSSLIFYLVNDSEKAREVLERLGYESI